MAKPQLSYEDALSYINGLDVFAMKLGLERISKIMEVFDNPHLKYKTIHITGTNGKGSVSTMVASILAAAGYRVGLYTSPHISDFRERILIFDENGQHEIDEKSVGGITARIKDVAGKLGEALSYFEAGTALAFQYFAEQEVDFGVIEVGLGGRLDATNVVKPEVSVITTISLEHTQHLGGDLASIAKEKGGIIKDGVPLVTGAEGEGLDALKQICKERNSPLIHVGTDVKFQKTKYDSDGLHFDVSGRLDSYEDTITKLFGDHQAQNAAISIAAIECLKEKGSMVPRQFIYDGMESAFIPGRFEVVSEAPRIILDVAHNPQAMTALAGALKSINSGKIRIVAGMMADKDIESSIRAFSGVAETIIATRPRTPRAAEAERIAKAASAAGIQSVIFEDVRKGFEYAKFISNPEDILCVTGSFYTVGEIRPQFFKK
ncbi:MAG: bifunctional folylpolyglutamate synthase/dihydrofolate synthase [Candidatus Thermoplasmatota archaeon]|nr:bifunctional folylpolyglutamate synthase/dihydrofolate synthase [Candidatus Thermoplasmatota archaeon]